MKMNLYPKLAWHGMIKNKQIYLPFCLTSIGIVMMYYIVSYLTYSDSVRQMRGGRDMQMILSWGIAVVAIFAVIFLFYMNSFLMRRRKKEFGLYNILGMDKWNIVHIIFWQNLLLFGASLVGGLGFGIIFSKLAELFAYRLTDHTVQLGFSIEAAAVQYTVILTVVIYVILLLYSILQIHVAKPIELLRSENFGEKPPKARWFIALIGAVLLAVAYYLAVTIQDPMTALSVFFVAIVMVILATYLLFICGSVTLCKILKKNKKYYYKVNHFVSVSSMAYRMKRNGASLASICILCTAVLVMISSSFSLYIGTEDSMMKRYPTEFEVSTYSTEINAVMDPAISDIITKLQHDYQIMPENELCYQALEGFGIKDQNSGTIQFDIDEKQVSDYSKVINLYCFTLKEYMRISGKQEKLNSDEILIYSSFHKNYTQNTITFADGFTVRVKESVNEAFVSIGGGMASIIDSIILVVPDDDMLQKIWKLAPEQMRLLNYYGFDTGKDSNTQIAFYQEMQEQLEALQKTDTVNYACREERKDSFYSLYGGLLFLGILLSIVFMFGTVLIMYYKQVSEGYEDAKRFAIMQKVGMTKKEIKNSINSQVLTVFASPLFIAGIHTGFAFPLILQLLKAFALQNTVLLIGVTIASFILFGILYGVMYLLTSKVYYKLVK